MEKEKWIDEVMSSLHGIKRAEPNPFLFTRIEQHMKEPAINLADVIIPLPKLSLVFAGVALLLLINFSALKNLNSGSGFTTAGSAQAYSLNNIHYRLY